MARQRYVVHAGPFVDKFYPDAPLEVEFEKSQRLWQLWQANPLAASPQPLKRSESERRIRFAYLPADGSLAAEYVRYLHRQTAPDSFHALVEDIARALAHLHRELRLSTRTPWTPPAAFAEAARSAGLRISYDLSATPQAHLHCDFGFANICFRRRPGGAGRQIVLYDPSPNRHSTFAADQFGSVYVDLGCLLASLNGRFPLHQHATARWRLASEAKSRFLAAYERASGWGIDARLAEAVGYATAFASFSRTHGRGLRRRLAMKILYNRFKRNTHWMEAFHEPAHQARRAA